jgi:hypothetical protein
MSEHARERSEQLEYGRSRRATPTAASGAMREEHIQLGCANDNTQSLA